jgi:hypothetical protein
MLARGVTLPATPHGSEERSSLVAAALAVLMAVGCKASVKAEANTSADLRSDVVEVDEVLENGDGADRSLGPEPDTVEGGIAPTLLGARHDVALVSGQRSVDCTCLSVALGLPNDPAFQWEFATPSIAGASQQIIAFTSQGTGCPNEPKDSLGASYWGYQIRGRDVVVLIEPARQGRPITTGAIIPKPAGGGRTFVAPVDPSVPYGKAKDGGARCAVEGR